MNNTTNNSNEIILVLCTLPNNKDFAFKLIKILLNLKLAACITLINKAHSFYYWNNKIENQKELQLLIKTKLSLQDSIFKTIKELHPYEIPELLVLRIVTGEQNYLNWINSML